MGDRGNIVVDGIWMYTHWGGSETKKTLKDALIRGKERWGDSPYLARIIFSEMIKDDVNGLTGFGLSVKKGDNQRDILFVDTSAQTIEEFGDSIKRWTFEEFVEEVRA